MNLTAVFTTILDLSIMGSVVAAVILLAKGLFRNKLNATWHYYIWILLIIRIMLPYTPESSLSIFNLMPHLSQRIELLHSANVKTDGGSSIALPDDDTLVSGSTGSNKDIIMSGQNDSGNTTVDQKEADSFDSVMISIVWLIGTILMILYLLIINMRLYLRIRKQPLCSEKNVINTFEKCRAILGVNYNIPIIYDNGFGTPSLVGLVRPRLIASPEIIKQLPEDELQFVFLHELAHIKRKDILINWILVLVQSLHWFNPVIWYAFNRIHEDCEMACDAYVLSHLKPAEHKRYGETIINLLSVVSRPYWPSVTSGMSDSRSGIKRRIKMIAMFSKNSWKWTIAAAILVIVIGVVSLTDAKEVMGQSTGSTGEGMKVSDKSSDEVRVVVPDALEVTSKPKVEVTVDLEIVKNDQQQVDQGHSPWQMDPLQVAMTFVSLYITPNGVQGEFPVSMEDMKVIQKTEWTVIVEVGGDKSPIERVYMKRLIKQDNTGIWTVVGYDPAQKQTNPKLAPFMGSVVKIKTKEELKVPDDEWQQVKKDFLAKRNPYPAEEIQILRQSDFKPVGVWQGDFKNKKFQLALYSNGSFQVLASNMGDEERIQLLQDFYYIPWIFYGDGVRFEQISKGAGVSYDITSGEFTKDTAEYAEIFDNIFYDLIQSGKMKGLTAGREITVSGNNVVMLDENSLVIK